MYILSKIITIEWFRSLVGAITILFMLITIGDIINGFMLGYEFGDIFLKYALKLPEMLGKLIPIACLLASLFSFNKLKNQSELMAILASGYSNYKIYSLIFSCSLLIAFIQLINLSYLDPFTNKIKRAEFEKSVKSEGKYLARSKIGSAGLLWYKSDNYFASFEAFDPKNIMLKNLKIYYQDTNGHLDSIIQAQSAKFIEDEKWQLKDIISLSNLSQESFPKSIKKESMFLALKESPSDFNQFESDITTLNIKELYNFTQRLKKTGVNTDEYQIMLYEKISLAFICIVFALVPLSIIFKPNRRADGFGKSIIITLGFTIFFWLIYSGLISMGNNGKLPALVATMGAPFIFFVYVILIVYKNKRL